MQDQQKEEQLCRLGDEADVLLKTDAFNLTVNQLVDACFQAFSNSKPVSTLQQRVSVRDEIQAKVAANDNNNQEE
jgi:hypothetical protein